VQIAAAVFEVGGRAAQHGNEAAQQVGNRFRPSRHAPPIPQDSGHVPERGPRSELMGMGVKGQDGQQLAGAQTNTAINHPNEAVTQGSLAQG